MPRTLRFMLLVASLVAALVASSCGTGCGTLTMAIDGQTWSSTSANDPSVTIPGGLNLGVDSGGFGGPLPDWAGNRVTATLDGAWWNAWQVMARVTPPPVGDYEVITGGNVRDDLTVGIPSRAFGSCPLGYTGQYPLQAGVVYSLEGGAQEWGGTMVLDSLGHATTPDSGSVTVTSVTATRIKGTFTAVLAPQPGASGVRRVAVGSFDVGIPPAVTPRLANSPAESRRMRLERFATQRRAALASTR